MTETRHNQPIHLGSPGEDISTKDLHAIIQRFKNLNQLRQQRVQAFLQPRQQVFLHLLPLLFHQNHPLLPGFISSETPAGIQDYKPDKQAIKEAKYFSKGFSYKRRARLSYPIQGIFLMGSVSSIAFSKTSDMDIWLCHQADLLSSDLDELQQKATAIEKWAASYDLEVHFFLVDSEQFLKGHDLPISFESSGNTQHYILLEEFYRTAIFIAGRIPAWWLVPPHQEKNYSAYIKHLIENRFISENEVIDFGGLESIPAEEFISATLWHIYKSINSPHKSLLKLFLMECYASEYPYPKWLSFELKSAIYQGTFDVDLLDPYLLIYLKVEKYLLEAGSTQRLNLARQCFYLKIMGATGEDLDYNSRVSKEAYLQTIARQRNWPESLLPALKKQKFWDIKKATQEHIIIRAQLRYCLRMVMSLAGSNGEYNFRENEDLKLISRKLHVFLERKPEKIEIITTRSSVYTKENELSIVEADIHKKSPLVWSLFSGKFDEKKESGNTLIRQEYSLLSLLGWLVINGLYHKQLQLNFKSSSLNISNLELHQMLNQLFRFLSKNLLAESASLSVYKKPDKLLSSLIFINLGQALAYERDDGMLVLSERSDPLSYGKERLCFIQQIDRISVSNWGEVTTFRSIGLDNLFGCLTLVFNNSKPPVSSQSLKVSCNTPIRAKSIVLRTESIFNKLVTFFSEQSPARSDRYFLAGEHSIYGFQRNNSCLRYWPMESTEQLLQELASTQNLFGDVHFESEVLENSFIPFLYAQNREQIIQVFYYQENTCVSVFIIDEKGALFTHQHLQSNSNQVLCNYSIFLESMLNHSFYGNDVQVKFYEIQKNSAGTVSCLSAKYTPMATYMDLSVRIIIELSSTNAPITRYYIYCNDIEFSSVNYGGNLFLEVSRYIMDCRKSKEDYPVHISDLEVPCSYLGVENNDQLQTVHYLKYKKKIEAKLNV